MTVEKLLCSKQMAWKLCNVQTRAKIQLWREKEGYTHSHVVKIQTFIQYKTAIVSGMITLQCAGTGQSGYLKYLKKYKNNYLGREIYLVWFFNTFERKKNQHRHSKVQFFNFGTKIQILGKIKFRRDIFGKFLTKNIS